MTPPLDPFISEVIDQATLLLAQQLHTLEKGIGIDRFVITGDFATSLGKCFLSLLKDNFKKVVGEDYFNRSHIHMQNLISLGMDDDNDGLIGVGKYLQNMFSRGKLAAMGVYGVHRRKDPYDNDVFEVATPKRDTYKITFVDGIFQRENDTLAGEYCKGKKVVVVVAEYLCPREEEIRAYFTYQKSKGIINDFEICFIEAINVTKHMDTVLEIIDAAERFGFQRRDLFVAIGGGSLMDMVGLAAAMYRRAASYVRIPMTLTGMVNSARLSGRVHVNYTDSRGIKHKNLLGMFHQPAACLIDKNELPKLTKEQIAHGLSEMIKVALIGDEKLFQYIEAHYSDMFRGQVDDTIYSLLNSSISAGLDQSQKDCFARNEVREKGSLIL